MLEVVVGESKDRKRKVAPLLPVSAIEKSRVGEVEVSGRI